MHKKVIVFLILAQLLIACSEDDRRAPNKSLQGSVFPQAFVSKENTRVDSFFQNRYRRGLFNGVALFAEDDTVVYKKAFGFANYRTKDTLTTESDFQLASTTKPLTAYAVLMLVHRGKISLQDSVRKFFPEFPYENINIHQLLTHRSGLPNYMYFSDRHWRDRRNITISNNDIIDLMIEYEPRKNYSPGKRYNYCNTNYALLASIIEKVSGKSYSDFMREEVFVPLGMNNSSVYDKDIDPENGHKVKGYISRRREADNSYLNGVVGDKGVYSSVEDLYKFNRELYEGKRVSKKLLDKSFFLAHKDLYDHDNYGYGWRVNMRPDSSMIVYHNGWWKGFRTYFYRDLKSKKSIIILTNRSNINKLYTRELLRLFDIETR